MPDSGRNNAAHRVVPVCPAWPQRAIPSPVGSHHFVESATSAAVSLRANFSVPPPSRVRRVTARERLHPKRGPPTEFPASS
jgi:hypothetical protein